MTPLQKYMDLHTANTALFIQQLRRRCNWTQQHLGDLLEVSRPTAARLETGETPFLEGQVRLICAALGLDIPHNYYQSPGGSVAYDLKEVLSNKDLPPGVLGKRLPLEIPPGFSINGYINRTLRFSPNGQMVAVPIHNTVTGNDFTYTSKDGVLSVESKEPRQYMVVIWRTDGQQLRTLPSSFEPVTIAFSPDSQFLIGVDWNGETVVWNIETGEEVSRLPAWAEITSDTEELEGKREGDDDDEDLQVYENFRVSPEAVAVFSPEGTYLAIAFYDRKSIHLIAWLNGDLKKVREIQTSSGVYDMVFAPNGNVIFASLREGIITPYSLSDGRPWLGDRNGSWGNDGMPHLAMLSSQDPGEYLLMFGGDGESLDVEHFQVTRRNEFHLAQRFFSLRPQHDAILNQLIALGPDRILTVSNHHIKPDIPFNTDELHNVFRIKNLISGLSVTVLDMAEYSPGVYKDPAYYTNLVRLAPDGSMVAIFDDLLWICSFNVRALDPVIKSPHVQIATLSGKESRYLPNLLYWSMGGVGHPEFTPYDDQTTFLLSDMIGNRMHKQYGVIISEDSEEIITRLVSTIQRILPNNDTTRIYTFTVPSNPVTKMERLANLMMETTKLRGTNDTNDLETLFTHIIPNALTDSIIILRRAERLSLANLFLLERSGWNSLYILIGNEDLPDMIRADFNLALRATLIPVEELN